MEPLIALIGVTAIVMLVNTTWLRYARGFEIALRAGVATMFTMTGLAHFVGMRAGLIEMIPDWMPAPGFIITLTGLLELAAALAMSRRRLAGLAAGGLTFLLIAMFPANVDLALSAKEIPWYDELVPRTVMQVIFVAATATVLVLTRRPIEASPDPSVSARQSIHL
jgi:uncharacterized membrane protein